MVGADRGLGFFIEMGRRLLMPDMIILGMVLTALTGVVITVIVGLIEQLVKAAERSVRRCLSMSEQFLKLEAVMFTKALRTNVF